MKIGMNSLIPHTISIVPLTPEDDLMLVVMQREFDHEIFLSDLQDLSKDLATLSRLGSIIQNITDHGVTKSLESLTDSALYQIAPSMFLVDKTNVPAELQVAYEGLLDSIKEKMQNMVARFKDSIKASFNSSESLQAQIRQELKRLEAFTGDFEKCLSAKIIANPASSVVKTLDSIDKIITDPMNVCKPTNNSFADNKQAMIKHGNSFGLEKSRDDLITFDPMRVCFKEKPYSKRMVQTLAQAGITDIQILRTMGQVISDFDVSRFYSNCYEAENRVLVNLNNFPISKLGEAEELYHWYYEIVYGAFMVCDRKLNDFLLMTLAALKVVK